MSTELDQLRRQNHDLHMRLDAVRRDRDRLYEEVLDLSATVTMLRRKHAGHTGRCGAVLYATATERIECDLPPRHRGAHRSPGRIWPARPDAEAHTGED